MYLDYWQLEAKPFEPACEARFLYRGEGRQAALHKLRYAIENDRAACLVAGPAGVGKTLLVDSLCEQLAERYRPIVRIVYPQMSERDFLALLAEQLGAPNAAVPRHTIDESLRRIEFVLGEYVKQGRRPIVVVDEAHLLEDSGLLEMLRLLLNFTVGGKSTFTLLLVGQPGVLGMIERFGALDERIDIKAYQPPLSAVETAAYLQHRLQAAGSHREIFTADAATAVHVLTGGAPRRINRLGDLALLVSFANERHSIDAEQVRSVHDELVAVAPARAA